MSIPILVSSQIAVPVGNATIPFSLCPNQLPIGAVKKYPTFFQNDRTGAYFGCNGYYASIPCWKAIDNNHSQLVQYSTFSILAGKLGGVDALLSNPTAYSGLLPKTDNKFQLPFPLNSAVPTQSINISYEAIYVSQGASSPPVSNGSFLRYTSKIPFNPLSVNEIVTVPPICENAAIYQGNSGNVGSFGSPTFNVPILLSGIACLPQQFSETILYTNYLGPVFDFRAAAVKCEYFGFPPGASIWDFDYFGLKMVNTFDRNGVSISALKVNPVSANFLGRGTVSGAAVNVFWCGNVLQQRYSANPFPMPSDYFEMKILTLANAADNTIFYSQGASVIQLPAGGYLVVPTFTSSTNPTTCFLFDDTCSQYVKLSLVFPSGAVNKLIQGKYLSADGAGFLYFIESGTSNLYWSGGPAISIQLPIPTLQNLNVSFDNCNPCSTPWIG